MSRCFGNSLSLNERQYFELLHPIVCSEILSSFDCRLECLSASAMDFLGNLDITRSIDLTPFG